MAWGGGAGADGESKCLIHVFTFQGDCSSSPTCFFKGACRVCSSAKQNIARKGNFANLTLEAGLHFLFCYSRVVVTP